MHGFEPTTIVPGQAQSEQGNVWQPSVGSDPTQGAGTPAWQRALEMGLKINAQNRRN